MKTIHILPQDIVSHIAAGQVIERPSSVVKELIENALDAHAQQIHVELHNGGYGVIRVIDDGDGMSKEDVEACFLPHATSKIAAVEDIVGIRSLGFRGEALSSIAAVGSLTVSSRQKGTVKGWKGRGYGQET